MCARELQIMHSRARFIRSGYREIAGFSLAVACEGLKSQARYSIANGMHKSCLITRRTQKANRRRRRRWASRRSLSLPQINMKPSSAIFRFLSLSLTGRLIVYA